MNDHGQCIEYKIHRGYGYEWHSWRGHVNHLQINTFRPAQFPPTFRLYQNRLNGDGTTTYEGYVGNPTDSTPPNRWKWKYTADYATPGAPRLNPPVRWAGDYEAPTWVSNETNEVNNYQASLTQGKPWVSNSNQEPTTRPEFTVMIKYVKHGTWRKACPTCGASGLVWAHEVPEGVKITGDEPDYCQKCKTTGAQVLVDPKLTPTGKLKPHSCQAQESSAGGSDGEGDTEGEGEAQAEAGEGGEDKPDDVGAGATSSEDAADPWLDSEESEANADGEAEGEDESESGGDPDDPFVKHSELAQFEERKDTELQVLLKGQTDHLASLISEAEIGNGMSDEVRKHVETLMATFAQGSLPVTVSILHDDGPAEPLPGLHHKTLPEVITLAAARRHVLMVGGAGVGKGKMARQAADALGLKFYALPGSLSPQTPVSAIVGYMTSSGKYSTTMFRRAFEEGGIIFLDELDNAHPACIAAANDALAIEAGDTIAFPDKMVKRHPDFICIAAANTYGRGPDQNYAARQRGDVATWDRFFMLDVEIDEPLEMTLCTRTGANIDIVSEVLRFVRALRHEAKLKKMSIVLGPRASIDMCYALKAGLSVELAVYGRCRRGMSDQDWMRLTEEVADIDLENPLARKD